MRAPDRRVLIRIEAFLLLLLSASASLVAVGPVAILTTCGSVAILVVLAGERIGMGRASARTRITGFAVLVAFMAVIGLQDTPASSGVVAVSLCLGIALTSAVIALVNAWTPNVVQPR